MENSHAVAIDWDAPIRVVSIDPNEIYGNARLVQYQEGIDSSLCKTVECDRTNAECSWVDRLLVDPVTGAVHHNGRIRVENIDAGQDAKKHNTRPMVELFLKLDFSKATMKTTFGSLIGYRHDQVIDIAIGFCSNLERMQHMSVPDFTFFVEEFKSQRGFQEWLP